MTKKSALNMHRFRALMKQTGQAVYLYEPQSGAMIWDDAAHASALLGFEGDVNFTDYDAFLEERLGAERASHRRLYIAQVHDRACHPELGTADGSHPSARENDMRTQKTGVVHPIHEALNRSGAMPSPIQYQLETGVKDRGWFEEVITWVDGPDGEAGCLMGVIRSVDDQKAREQQLGFLAAHDERTGVLNRRRLKDILSSQLSVSREKGETLSYILVGIDGVPLMNANFGHAATDDVILEVAERLRSVLRRADCLGRVSGTKFGIVLSGTTAKQTREICNRLSASIRATVFNVSGSAVSASICMGVVHLDAHDATGGTVFADAETALQEARHMGDGACFAFTDKISGADRRKNNSEITDFILSALNQRRMCLAYQPIVENPGDSPQKFECLVRIKDERDGFALPAAFIPAAERLGLVHLIDRRVLELAIETLSTVPDIELNVNVSWDTVKDPVWADGYMSLLKAYRAQCSRVTVELTETKAVDAAETLVEFVTAIKALGCKFAIDDFGAGCTSFKSLQCLDIDVLKIDGSFVHELSSNPQNKIFIRTFVDLAHNFEIETVAEWVDNEEDAALLKSMGVKYLQGYILGKPEVNPGWLADPESQPASKTLD